jgi:hypothetical protein
MYSKKGETYKQLLERASSEVKALKDKIYEQRVAKEEAIKAAATLDVTNPRTGKSYKQEATVLFETMAIIEHAIRTKQDQYIVTFARECLDLLGYDTVSLYENKATTPGAYNGEK